MAVTIKVPALWRSAAGGTLQVELPTGNLADVLNALVERLPSLGTHLFDEKGSFIAILARRGAHLLPDKVWYSASPVKTHAGLL